MAFAFSFRATAAFLAASSVAIFAASSLVTGCSSSSDAAAADAGTAVCPTTLTDAIGKTCDLAKPCIVGFVCPKSLNEIATCNCTSGSWACVDGQGAAITNPSADANCTALGGGNNAECPADEASASFANCKTPGLVCSYAGPTCPGSSKPNTDQCQCVGATHADGGAFLNFVCEGDGCLGPPADGGKTGDGGDAG